MRNYTGSDVIRHDEIEGALEAGRAQAQNKEVVEKILVKAKEAKGLSFTEAAVLL